MSQVHFHKYHGTGNDFILVDNRLRVLQGTETAFFKKICHRHFGIGADGVILLNQHPDHDFEMDYFNSDGNRSSMCGNGGRCMARFAADLGIVTDQADFVAIDGGHEAFITPNGIRLKMTLPHSYRRLEGDDHWIHTGSPHYVKFFDESVGDLDVVHFGREIRYSPMWAAEGTNVNFVYPRTDGSLEVRTYERGVENETMSCGTGVTAVAEVVARKGGGNGTYTIHTPGGTLQVHVMLGEEPWLGGPAQFVFEGTIDATW